MHKYILFSLLVLLVSCAGTGKNSSTPQQQDAANGFLLPIQSQEIYTTVDPTLNLVLVKSLLTIDKTRLEKRTYGYFIVNSAFYISSISANGRKLRIDNVRSIKPNFFGQGLTDSQWDRVREFGSLYRIDFTPVAKASEIIVTIEGSLRITEQMTCCQLDENEFLLDGESFWYPAVLDDSYPIHLEVLHPAKFSVELLDNAGAFEEVTPTLSRSIFDVSDLQGPLLLTGESY